jgi:UDP-glucose 4-epimerase
VFNFGSGNGYSVLQVIRQFEELLHQKINYRLGDRRAGDLERLVTASEKA